VNSALACLLGFVFIASFALPLLADDTVSPAAAFSSAADLLKVSVVNDSDSYTDDQVYVQMVGTDPSGSGNLGHVDLATSTWVAISEADNTVGPLGGRMYTGYAEKLSSLTAAGPHTWSFNMPRIISGRVYVSFEQPVYFHVSPGPALETPSAVDSALPNYNIIFDKVELDWQNGQLPFLNTTTVDFFSISFMLELVLTDGTSQTRGFNWSRKAIMDALQGLPAIWQNGVVSNSSGIIRFIAPQNLLDPNPFADFFDSYVTECWNYYTTNPLTLQSPPNTAPWSATGQVAGGVFTFNVTSPAPEVVTINNLVGQGKHIFGCDGVGFLFTTGSDSLAKQGIITQMAAALNRSVLFNIKDSSTWWNNAALFYAQDETNQYSMVLHEAAYQGYCYGFPYDDVGNFSTGVTGDATEAVVTIQKMTDQPCVRLKPNKSVFSTTDSISIAVDVSQPITTQFYPGFYIALPSGQRLYITEGNRLTTTVTPYLQRKVKKKKKYVPVAITVPAAESNIQLVSGSFKNIPAGDYILRGGAVNAQTPFANGDINWLPDCVDTEILRVQ